MCVLPYRPAILRAVLPVLVLALGTTLAASEATSPGWPCYRGPNGDFSAPYAGELLQDLNQAKLVWTSEEKNLGEAKYPISGWGGAGRSSTKGLPSGNGSPIVADGRVYVALFRPSGEAVDVGKVENGRAKHGESFRADFYRIEAEDIVLAIDAATGKTIWKQVLPGGLNRPTVKRSGWGVTPVAADGRVFATTTMGRVNAFDAATGEILWTSDNGNAAESDAQKAKALENKTHDRGSDAMNAGMALIGGVLLVPDFRDGICALDPQTGKRLWYRPDIRAGRSVPAPWRSGGKEWIVVGSQQGELRLLDPATGQELWTVAGLSRLPFTLTVEDDLVFVLVPPEETSGRATEGKKDVGAWAAYRLSQQGAELAWQTPFVTQYGGDAGPMHIVVAHGGVVFLGMHISGPTALVDQATGKTLQEVPKLGNLVECLWGDRLIIRAESDHDSVWRWFTTDPDDFRELGKPWKPSYIAGYTTPMLWPFADGFIFMRCPEEGGTIRCYDLRQH